jgi:CHAT domain-containing protein
VADSTRQLTFNPLPGVPQELRSIIHDKTAARSTANGDGILEGRVMLDESFTKDALRTALRQQYSLVHIASHFMFQPGNETDSFLLLGGMDEQNNKLTIAELKRLSFEGVNLLTLSACETALGGEKANGVEVESFGVLAQRQGAGAVMATLWPVADVSTPLLMKEFYRLRETNAGMTKAEALRRAQVALLTGDIKPAANGNASRGLMTADGAATKSSFAHPFYWAPFILIGNWK